MRVRNLTGTFWPSALHEQLLVVALEDRHAAVSSWQELRPRLSLDTLELGSFQLLPLIYRNLTRGGYDDADLPRLKGVYRRAWVTNNLLVERTKESSAALAEAGVPALFIEGVMIASRFYPTLGLRPTSSIDVLVDEGDGVAALASLVGAGWRERSDVAAGRRGIRYLFDDNQKVCILRTVLAVDVVRPIDGRSSHALMWETADQHFVGDAEVRVPPPTETLFAVCVMHARVESTPNVQWIADAKMVLQTDVDWQRLLVLAEESGQVSRLRDALGFLGSLPGPKPPAEVCDRLATTKVTRRQRLSYLCTAGWARGAGGLPSLVAEHLVTTTNRSFLGTIATFPRFLRDRWSLAHTWQVPIAAGRRAVGVLSPRRRVV